MRKSIKNAKLIRFIIAFLVLTLLFLLPPLLYVFISSFPGAQILRKIFTTPIIFGFLVGLQIISLIWLIIQLFLFYRLRPLMFKQLRGQNLLSFLLGGIVTHGAFIVGLTGLILVAIGSRADQALLWGLHISEVIDWTTVTDLIMLYLSFVSFAGVFIGLPLLLRGALLLFNGANNLNTLMMN